MILNQEMDFHQDLLFQMQHCLVMPVHVILILKLGKGLQFLGYATVFLFKGLNFINIHAGLRCKGIAKHLHSCPFISFSL